MITLKKISSLKPRVQIRKVGQVILKNGEGLHYEYINGLKNIVLSSTILSDGDKDRLVSLLDLYSSSRDPLVAKDIHYLVLTLLGEESADWDLLDADGKLDASTRTVLPHSLFLDRVRSPYNIGAIFRSAESFCVDHVYLRSGCGDVDSPRCLRTGRGAVEAIPHTPDCDLSVLEGKKIFALETGGTPLKDFVFPEDAVCVLGSEEDGVSPDVLALCSGRVSIEQYGAKGSINVSVAAGILLHAWAQFALPLS